MLSSLFLLLAQSALAADKYESFAALARGEKEGSAYRIVVERRSTDWTVMAIHGGTIEPVTSELAREVAAADWSLYLFEGLQPGARATLHLTSHRFDEPRALELAEVSARCLSIHGYREPRDRGVCVGGADAEGRRAYARLLAEAGLPLDVTQPCRRFPGTHPRNPVNRCRGRGIQLELSAPLRERLRDDTALRARFVAVTRRFLERERKAAARTPR